jgi:predicted metal-dependent phosphoesterase TrpH
MPTYRIDLHGHCQGDPLDDIGHTIHQHIDHAHASGLDAIALTWHRRIFADESAIAYAREKGVLLIPGVETELFGRHHTIVLNVAPGEIPANPTLEDLRRIRQNPDYFVLAPHPYYPHSCCLGKTIDEYPECFDGVEWCHYHFKWIPSAISPNERARRWAKKQGKPLIACSDAHDLHALGQFYSEVDAEELSAPALFAALRAGRVWFTPMAMPFDYLVEKTTILARDMLGFRRRRPKLIGGAVVPARTFPDPHEPRPPIV